MTSNLDHVFKVNLDPYFVQSICSNNRVHIQVTCIASTLSSIPKAWTGRIQKDAIIMDTIGSFFFLEVFYPFQFGHKVGSILVRIESENNFNHMKCSICPRKTLSEFKSQCESQCTSQIVKTRHCKLFPFWAYQTAGGM